MFTKEAAVIPGKLDWVVSQKYVSWNTVLQG
jgi:hypothetical protein